MNSVRSALFLDFDNVFGGLLKLDPDVAVRFGESPAAWLTRLSDELTVTGPRRWLVLRCYLNPEGSVPHPGRDGERLRFSRFRRHFTQAGFEIVDCPRLGYTKNAADIRMVMDALDALRSPAAPDEFVIASGDSDLTPLLVRLRAEDRRTTVVSASEAAEAFIAVADLFISGDQLLGLVEGERPDREDAESVDPATPIGEPLAADGAAVAAAMVRQSYAVAREPLNLSSLAQQVRHRVQEGPGGDLDTWFGHGGFRRFLASLHLPHQAMAKHHLWDQLRHVPPREDASGGTIPEAVARLTSLLGIPALEPPRWVAIYGALGEYAANMESFNLSECTRWARDKLADGDLSVGRSAVGVVVKGAAYGDCPIYRLPRPTAAEIGVAFVANALARGESAGAVVDGEIAEVREWFGVGDDVRQIVATA